MFGMGFALPLEANGIVAAVPPTPTWYDGLTNLVAVYQPKGAANLVDSYTNIINPGTFDAAPGVAPTFVAASGWVFNGINQYLTTGVVPGASWTCIISLDGPHFNTTCPMLVFDGIAGSFGFQFQTGNTLRFYNGGQQQVAYTSPTVATIAGSDGYIDGVDVATVAGTSTNILPAFLGCANISGVPSQFQNGIIAAAAFCSSIQTAGQILTASLALAAL